MAPSSTTRKRKAAPKEDPVISSDADDSDFGELEGILSQSDTDSEDDSEHGQGFDSEEELGDGELEALDSDEVPSEDEKKADEPMKYKSQVVPRQTANRRVLGLPNRFEEDDEPNYRVVKDANGNDRYEYEEIEPGYDSDDSDAPINDNTIGDIPLTFYDSYPHIGYNINGKKIMRPAKGEALDALLDSIDVPKGWTGLIDPETGKPLNLSQQELEILKRVAMNDMPEDGYDPYPDTIEYFTSITEQMPLSAAPEPKRRFLPSKHEAKRVMKIVRAIREGRIEPYKPQEEEKEEDEEIHYDIWQDEQPRPDHVMNIPAPKATLPGYDMSYNPPPEYLPTEKEKAAYENTDPEDRDKEYLPQAFDALRKVPAYDKFINERFERSLDLYLAPRVRKNRLNIDPASLLPKLPRPEELRPFPTVCATLFRGHEGRVRSLAIDPSGLWLASGGDDGTVRIWELLTGRQVWSAKIGEDEAVNVVKWRPGRDAVILSAAAGDDIFLMVPSILSPEVEVASRAILDVGFGYMTGKSDTLTAHGLKKDPPARWTRPGAKHEDEGVLIKITVRSTVKVISWHRRGDFFSTVSPTAQKSAVAIHTLTKHLTQIPFRRLPGLPQYAQFHPSRPLFFVATQRTIRSYDLQKQELVKIIQPGARWISSFDIHPGGDNLIVGSYDRRLLWHDLDLSSRPYKTMRFHEKAIRAVKYHKTYPLFADASDDGSLQIFHGKVVSDLMENATIVPVKVLKGHKVKSALGVMDIDWHPKEPWCVSAGADGTCRLWM